MKKILFLIPLIIGCSTKNDNPKYEKLLEFEGKYEYVGENSLNIVVSEMDTILYAVINKAKYPLNHIKLDSFKNVQGNPVVFQRSKNNNVISYKAGGDIFKLISREFDKIKMYPRKELFKNPDDYSYQKPTNEKDGLETDLLKNVFKNTEPVLKMVKETIKGNFPDVHSVLIYKNDKLVLEEYFYGYDKNTPHQLRSATKPFIGSLIGIAIDKGNIGSEQDKLLPYFESKYNEIDNLDSRKKEITIEDFLMYRHGMDCANNNSESIGNEQAMMKSSDWVKYTLDLPMINEAGISSSYCTGCALTLGNLIEITTKREIENFAKEYLFAPMGITNYNWRFEPNQSSISTFSQMSITPRDLVKLAKMYLNEGKWQGQQILSKKWVSKTFDMEDGDYGYLWKHKYFIINGKQYNSYMATGNGGQKINIWPELDMITVFTGGNYNSYELYGKSTPPNEMIPNYILKAVE